MDSTNINNIREQFQSTFNGFESEPPVDGWERLEASLNAADTASRFVRRRWYISAAAAVLLLLIGSTLFLRTGNEQIIPEVAVVQPSDVETEKPTDNQEPEIVPQHEIIIPHNEPPLLVQNNRNQQETITVADIAVQPIEQYETPETPIEENIETPQTQPVRTNEPQQLLGESILIAATGRNDHFLNDLPQRRRRENISVSVGGRGGLAPFHMAVNNPMTLRAAAVDEDNMFVQSEVAVEHQAEKTHAPPISFGATVSIPLAPNLFIETGLVYSFLSSRTRNDNVSRYEQETQHLHYLGIPLTINYRVLQLNNFNLYASAGGMIEQGIHGEFQRAMQGQPAYTQAVTNQAMETIRIRQENPQFSVNVGVGASIPLFNQFRLYGRIGGAYYFDARNAHRTIYSDQRIVLDLNLGIRYEF